jgi:hypothetical protein
VPKPDGLHPGYHSLRYRVTFTALPPTLFLWFSRLGCCAAAAQVHSLNARTIGPQPHGVPQPPRSPAALKAEHRRRKISAARVCGTLHLSSRRSETREKGARGIAVLPLVSRLLRRGRCYRSVPLECNPEAMLLTGNNKTAAGYVGRRRRALALPGTRGWTKPGKGLLPAHQGRPYPCWGITAATRGR